MITHKELLQFTEYIEIENLKINLEINQEEQILSSIIWYNQDGVDVYTKYKICPAIRKVIVYDGIPVNQDLSEFFRKMGYWEHEFCINNLGNDGYSFFDYVKDKWSVCKKG